MTDGGMREQTIWRPGRPVPLAAIVGTLRRGAGDPTFRYDRGSVWRAMRTPLGPATAHLVSDAAAGEVHCVAWGPGRQWVLDRLPQLLGDADVTADDFTRAYSHRHPFVVHALRRHPHYRVQRTGLVFEALLAAVLEQKVTGQEAFAGWRRLVRRFGDPAPGAGAQLGLRVVPPSETVLRIPSWEWLRLPVDPARSRAAVTAARARVRSPSRSSVDCTRDEPRATATAPADRKGPMSSIPTPPVGTNATWSSGPRRAFR